MIDTYLSIKEHSESLFTDKGSKFYGYAFRVSSDEEIKDKLAFLRKEHHKARHHCYAYRLGADLKKYRANDDGEPNNSAGAPILGQIQSFELSNVLIVVVRYFGGTKLGVSGLINAYKTAAKMALEKTDISKYYEEDELTIQFPYEQMDKVMKLLRDWEAIPFDQKYDVNCSLKFRIRKSKVELAVNKLEDFENVKVTLMSK